jgi:GTP 3',8-cyclase
MITALALAAPLNDGFARPISYLRLSVTDRCDLRCTYCMAEHMSFLPKTDVLSVTELERLCDSFIGLGIRKIRLTGGEPLVRRDIMTLVSALTTRVRQGALDEVTLTTNGTQLAKYANELAEAGIKRINVSLDTLDPIVFERITRRDALGQVMQGIDAADKAGIKIKINTVALAQDNLLELPSIIAWAHGRGFDLTLIETMPLGEVEGDRTHQFVSLTKVRAELESFWTLADLHDQSDDVSSGPANYVRLAQTGGRLGFITPLTKNFCATCNRVRVTCTGQLYTCLGQDDVTDLRAHLRGPLGEDALRHAITRAVITKPKAHDFFEAMLSRPAVARHMSVTGG